jgi:hypothetical protein
MSGGGTDARVLKDQERRRLNALSMGFATRQKEPWTDDDNMIILEEWVLVASQNRDELATAKRVGRSLYACQGRAEFLRAALDCQSPSHTTADTAPARPVCGCCFQEITPAGTCGCED